AALEAPERRVVCFTGDGSLLMNLQELATAAEERVDVTIVLLNNARLGLVRQQQELFYGGRHPPPTVHSGAALPPPPPPLGFPPLAPAFGIRAIALGAADDADGALAGALAAPGPVLVNVPIAADANVYPMVPPGAPNREMIDGARHGGIAA